MNKDNKYLNIVDSSDTDYVKVILEMNQHDIKDRQIITSLDGFSKSWDQASKQLGYKPDTDPIKFHRHDIKRNKVFMHEIFGNNYRMFGLEDKFDIDDMK